MLRGRGIDDTEQSVSVIFCVPLKNYDEMYQAQGDESRSLMLYKPR